MSIVGKIVHLEYFGKLVNGQVIKQEGAHLRIRIGWNHIITTTTNHVKERH